MQTDAQTFADWGVDLLKFDGCNSDYHDSPYGKRIVSTHLHNLYIDGYARGRLSRFFVTF